MPEIRGEGHRSRTDGDTGNITGIAGQSGRLRGIDQAVAVAQMVEDRRHEHQVAGEEIGSFTSVIEQQDFPGAGFPCLRAASFPKADRSPTE